MDLDWVWGFAGGLVIGLAGALFLLINGRILGASGIIGGLADGPPGTARSERLAFVAALFAAPALAGWVWSGTESNLTASPALLVVAGLMVGLGTRLANGCTSGHGVCGLSRLAPRGIVATLCFMGSGFLTPVVVRLLTGQGA